MTPNPQLPRAALTQTSKPARPGNLTAAILGMALALAGATAARAQNGTWTYNGSDTWNVSSRWANSTVAGGTNMTANFSTLNITADRTVTVDPGRVISDIITGDTSAGQSWIFSGATLTMANTTNPPQIRVLQNNATFNVVITGVHGLRKEQAGTLILNATNTYTGDTFINRGTLRLGSAAAIPSGVGYGDVYMNYVGGAPTLDLGTFSPTINGLHSSNGVGVVTASAASGTNTLTIGTNGASSSFSGVITDGPTCTLALTKVGDGTLTLRGSNNYKGKTTINGGTLVINGTNAAPGAVQVNGAGTLAGAGGLAGAVTISAGRLSPGDGGPGLFTLHGGLTINWSGAYVWELAALSTNNPGMDFDQIMLKGGQLTLGPARLVLQFSGGATAPDASEPFWQAPRAWKIISLNGGTNASGNNFSWIQNGIYPAGWFATVLDADGSILLRFTPATAATNTVDFSSIASRLFPPGVRGQNPYRTASDAAVNAMFNMSGPSLMRGVAGGLDADAYDWRVLHSGSKWGTPSGASLISTLDFLRRCRDTGSEPLLTANLFGGGYTNSYGTWICQFDNHTNAYNPGGHGTNAVPGTAAQLAADWVRYCNVIVPTYRQGQEALIGNDPNFDATNNAENLRVYQSVALGGNWAGRDVLLTNGELLVPRVIWWEIGNEPEVDLGSDSTLVNQHAIADKLVYRNRYRDIARAMKAVDGSILTGPCLVNGINSEWLGRVAEDTNAPLDFVGVHPYTSVLKWLWPNPTNMTAALLDLDRFLADHCYQTALTLSNYGGATRFGTKPAGWYWTTPLVASEYNPVNWDASSALKQSMASGMSTLEHCFRFAHPSRPTLPLQSYYGANYWEQPQGVVSLTNAFEALRDYAGDWILEHPSPGPQPVPDFGVPGSPMRVYITRQTNGANRIHVWGLNFSEDQDQSANLSFANLPFTVGQVLRRSFGKPGAENSLTNRTGLGWTAGDVTDSVNPSQFTFTVENASFAILTFQEITVTNWYWDASGAAGLQGGSGTWGASPLVSAWSTRSDGDRPLFAWADGRDAVFDAALTAGGTITVTGTVSPRAVVVNKANCNFAGWGTIQLGAGGLQINAAITVTNAGGNPLLSGAGGVTVNPGAGQTVTFHCTNTYSGDTVIASGTLALGARGGLPNTPQIVLANGATFEVAAKTNGFTLQPGQALRGDGWVSGRLTAQGTVSPGASVGTLNFSTNLTLSGTTIMDVSRSGSTVTNDRIVCSGTLTHGGTLIVTNTGPDPLAAGDTFVLFSAQVQTGAFGQVQLPPLEQGLTWEVRDLPAGVLRVAALPVFDSAVVVGTNLFLSGANGADGSPYYLLTSTNVALPLSNWARLLTNSFGSGGRFTNELPLAPGEPTRFFRLQSGD